MHATTNALYKAVCYTAVPMLLLTRAHERACGRGRYGTALLIRVPHFVARQTFLVVYSAHNRLASRAVEVECHRSPPNFGG